MTFVVLKPESVCAHTDTVLFPKWELFSWEAFRRQQLELSCCGGAHLDLDLLSTNISPSQSSKLWSCLQSHLLRTCFFFEDSPFLFLPSLHASGFMHFPLPLSGMMHAMLFLDWGNFSLHGKHNLFQLCRKDLCKKDLVFVHLMVVFSPASLPSHRVLLSKANIQPVYLPALKL